MGARRTTRWMGCVTLVVTMLLSAACARQSAPVAPETLPPAGLHEQDALAAAAAGAATGRANRADPG